MWGVVAGEYYNGAAPRESRRGAANWRHGRRLSNTPGHGTNVPDKVPLTCRGAAARLSTHFTTPAPERPGHPVRMVSAPARLPPSTESEPLAAYYERVRSTTLALAAPLTAEDQVVQTIPEVSPTKWHLAHVTWFFEHFCLLAHDAAYRQFDERYHHLFNSYYYTVGEMHRRARRGVLSRPTVIEIHKYREHVDAAMLALIARRAGDPDFDFLVTLGLNHEQQHQELLLTDIKHVLFVNPLGPAYRPAATPQPLHESEHDCSVREASAGLAAATHPSVSPAEPVPGLTGPLRFVEFEGGQFEIGAEGDGFCFDNETPRHRVLVRDHAIANRLVTNGEFRAFIDDGAYDDPAIWLSDGWAKIREEGWNRPLCSSEDMTREFTLNGWRELDSRSPVCHVSYYEADAFARWAGARLPTEAEWELAAHDSDVDGNLLDSGHLHPAAAPGSRPGAHEMGQLWGDVWEWTSSSYDAYPGFVPLAGSLGEYNGKFMCNQMVVRGGSCATSRDHIRASYRSFFYPHDRWQFLGFRLARDL